MRVFLSFANNEWKLFGAPSVLLIDPFMKYEKVHNFIKTRAVGLLKKNLTEPLSLTKLDVEIR